VLDTQIGRVPRREAGRVRAIQVIKWIEAACYIPEGKLVGRQVRLQPWQKDCIRAIYDNSEPTRMAIISVGRKNSKTTLAAFLLLNHLCGPSGFRNPNGQLFSTALSRDQAAIVFNLASKIVRLSPDLRDAIDIRDTAKELIFSGLGTRYRALSADAATAYGLSPSFTVHDELGQVKGPRSALFDAMETATGAQEHPLSVVISTQARNDSDLLSILIDDARAGYDPRTVLRLYTAPMDLDPFEESTVKLANPALGTFLNKSEVMAMAEAARRMPAREAEFRNLVLNQRIEANNPFVTQTAWKVCGAEPEPLSGMPVYGGLDLSSVAHGAGADRQDRPHLARAPDLLAPRRGTRRQSHEGPRALRPLGKAGVPKDHAGQQHFL
jgi:phage terminase large subunit-like protein